MRVSEDGNFRGNAISFPKQFSRMTLDPTLICRGQA